MGGLMMVVALLLVAGLGARGALRATPLAVVIGAGLSSWAARCRVAGSDR